MHKQLTIEAWKIGYIKGSLNNVSVRLIMAKAQHSKSKMRKAIHVAEEVIEDLRSQMAFWGIK